jgi:hypothetical protein
MANGSDTVLLQPTSKRLKQLVKEFGPVWTVRNRVESAQCFGGEPGISIAAMNAAGVIHERWVRPADVRED